MDEKDKELQELRVKLAKAKDAINEKCIGCGKYRESHLGACNGCPIYDAKWEL